MFILTLKERIVIDDAIKEFGTDHQRSVWRFWLGAHPQVRTGPNDPLDDGDGPIPAELLRVVVDVIHQQFEHYQGLMESDDTDDDEACFIANDAAELRSIHRAFCGEYPDW